MLAAAFSLASCQLPSEAERATCESVSERYGNYVEQDPSPNLTDEDKARTHRLIRTWRMRVGLPPLEKKPSEVRWESTTGTPITGQGGPAAPAEGQGGVGMSLKVPGVTPALGGYHVVVFAGQSNINGRGVSPRTLTDGHIIWVDRKWANMTPGVNTCDAFLPKPSRRNFWGPEVAFSKLAGGKGVKLAVVKLASDASYVVPVSAIGNNWNPSLANNLTELAVRQISEAISTLDAPVLSSTLVWYQGESEAMWDVLVPLFEVGTASTVNTLMAVMPKPHLIRVAIHGATVFPPPAQPAVRKIQGTQQSSPLGGSLISVDDLTLFPDNIHLNESSLDQLGIRIFEKWVNQ